MSQALGLCHESRGTFIPQTVHVQLGLYAILSFLACFQTVIHHELIMVLRVNQACGGTVEGGGGGPVEGYMSLVSLWA